MPRGKKKLTVKEKKLVAGIVSGDTQVRAYEKAGYAVGKSKSANAVNANKAVKRPHVQEAIDAALAKHGMTPEWAVQQLGKVAEQDKEIGAKRLAAKDILELHGWNKAERPTMSLKIDNAFFGDARRKEPIEGEIIDGE